MANEMSAQITFKIDPDLLSAVDRIALQRKMSRSELIRLAIRRFLQISQPENENKNEDQPLMGYKCPFCGLVVTKIWILKMHITRYHKGIRKCPVCGTPLTDGKRGEFVNHCKRYSDPLHRFWYILYRKGYWYKGKKIDKKKELEELKKLIQVRIE